MARNPRKSEKEFVRPYLRRSAYQNSSAPVDKPTRVSQRLKTKLGPPVRRWMSEEKYDALIQYVRDDECLPHDKERSFVMPSQILFAAAQCDRNTATELESMPVEILLMVTQHLGEVDRISLALTSTRMARMAQADMRPARALIALDSEKDTKLSTYRFWYYRAHKSAELRTMIGKWMGPRDYLYCNLCQKFRPADEQFWWDLFRYGWPDQLTFYKPGWPGWFRKVSHSRGRRSRKNVEAKDDTRSIVNDPRVTQQQFWACLHESSESRRIIVESLLDHWRHGGPERSRVDGQRKRICPAHIFCEYPRQRNAFRHIKE